MVFLFIIRYQRLSVVRVLLKESMTKYILQNNINLEFIANQPGRSHLGLYTGMI